MEDTVPGNTNLVSTRIILLLSPKRSVVFQNFGVMSLLGLKHENLLLLLRLGRHDGDMEQDCRSEKLEWTESIPCEPLYLSGVVCQIKKAADNRGSLYATLPQVCVSWVRYPRSSDPTVYLL